ncbi:polysaccharide pyruvyl transferase [Williamsia limnetica]|uniref:Polysaccharide pyruvyl transferase n=1 Tax=Williamsia limnetica TaxID=882452 RepID=A0A318RMA8_WILLI|nr:polysaccharide pyruvyl transferase family protein [Williamsia limnetica]PYE17455.1 polysaccharide pyruvyl transferase [Williamsia limnetica]
MKVLLVSWATFTHGEATAGDVLAVRRVENELTEQAIDFDTAWSPVFRPGELCLDDVAPEDYTHLVFICGPCHGEQVESLHHRFPDAVRIAVGVSVIDADDPAVTGFDRVIARDGDGRERHDLATFAPLGRVPVVAVILAPGQGEYGDRRRHERTHAQILEALAERDVAVLPVDTRLDTRDATAPSTPEQLCSVLSRADAVVSTRLHGLVLGLRMGVPVLAIDPVDGGAKVSAQARIAHWPAALTAGEFESDRARFDELLTWCLGPRGRWAARATTGYENADPTTELVKELSI